MGCAHSRHGEQMLGIFDFTENAVIALKTVGQGPACAVGNQKQPFAVIIMILGLIEFDVGVWILGRVDLLMPVGNGPKMRGAAFFGLDHPFLHRNHDGIAGAGALQHRQITGEHIGIDSRSAVMQKRAHVPGGQQFVGAVNDHVGPGAHGILGIGRVAKFEMGAMGFVDNEPFAFGVEQRRDGPHVADIAEITRRGHHKTADIGMFVEGVFDNLRRHDIGVTRVVVGHGIDKPSVNASEGQSGKNRAVAIGRHQHRHAGRPRREHRRHVAGGAAADQNEGALTAVKLGNGCLRLANDTVGIVQIIGAFDFRDIKGRRKRAAAFVPRHMKAVAVLPREFGNLFSE